MGDGIGTAVSPLLLKEGYIAGNDLSSPPRVGAGGKGLVGHGFQGMTVKPGQAVFPEVGDRRVPPLADHSEIMRTSQLTGVTSPDKTAFQDGADLLGA
jgi:hypothetical protein